MARCSVEAGTMRRLLRISIGIVFCATLANASVFAQDAKKDDVLGDFGRWLDRSLSSIGDQFKSAGKGIDKGIDNFNRDAGAAAKTTASAAADAADAVAKLPNTRVVSGRQDCPLADNGAPDCAAAATKLCQSKGMKSGSSLEVTSARDCPTRALIQREARTQCRDVTFVTRAMCQ
jgi:hypothetical protein